MKKVVSVRQFTDAQLLRLLRSLNIPVHSAHAAEMEEALAASGLKMPKETWCRKPRTSTSISPPIGAKFSYGTTKSLPQPDFCVTKQKRPRLDDDNLSQSDAAVNFMATVSTSMYL